MTRSQCIRSAVRKVTRNQYADSNAVARNLEREFESLGLVRCDCAGPQSDQHIKLVVGAMYMAARWRCGWGYHNVILLIEQLGGESWTFSGGPPVTNRERFLVAHEEWALCKEQFTACELRRKPEKK